ncbi:YceH family protein [Colwellia sp. UCD-KL20]|uniref:YceH family protein n=1 Tax=Colwellia sp. UCD-KL20 TaxID=1917165 RepID=UPI0009703E7C|nr:YceH family protein [Colwellia sp. UCD-KL20]
MLTLTAIQCRVIGVMLEKETTTPEQYPLSLNSLSIGCNQKSSREPVMSLSESDVQNEIDALQQANLLMVDHQASGRVNKYIHRFCNTEFGDLQFTPQQRAIICVLLLRGPQTPGELRTRTNRLADFANVTEVEATLTQLQNLNGQVLVKKLAREPGKRECRYLHLLSPSSQSAEEEVSCEDNTYESSVSTHVGNDTRTNVEKNAVEHGDKKQENTPLHLRVTELEQQVAALTEQVALLTLMIEDND